MDGHFFVNSLLRNPRIAFKQNLKENSLKYSIPSLKAKVKHSSCGWISFQADSRKLSPLWKRSDDSQKNWHVACSMSCNKIWKLSSIAIQLMLVLPNLQALEPLLFICGPLTAVKAHSQPLLPFQPLTGFTTTLPQLYSPPLTMPQLFLWRLDRSSGTQRQQWDSELESQAILHSSPNMFYSHPFPPSCPNHAVAAMVNQS